jgi:hypothetical protein
MDGVSITAIVGGTVALVGVSVTAIVTYHRSKLEANRIQHEKQKWLLELHAEFEKRLHEIRLQEYPAILAELERLSHLRIASETPESLRELAGKLNAWGYSKAGMCMSSQTRDALFKLRYKLTELASMKLSDKEREDLMQGMRTDLIEWLRRDVNHSASIWRNLPSLLRDIEEAGTKLGSVGGAASATAQ